MRHNGGPHGGDQALDPAYPTLPERFAAAGYATGLVGKYLNGYQPEADAPEPGWDLWQPLVRGVYSYDRYTYAGEERSWADDEVPYVTTSIARRTDDAVRELAAGDDPFLLFSWHVAPHYKPKGKVHAPPPSLPRDRRKYRDLPAPSLTKPNYNQAEVSDQPQPIRKRPVMKDAKNERMYRARVRSLLAVDRSVASLVRTLRETGELADTYLVFASDNGHALGEHRLFGKNVLVDEIMDVPVVVRGPGVPAGATSSVPATLVDLPATLLDLAAIDDTTGLDGQSLLAPALGARRRVPRHDPGADGWPPARRLAVPRRADTRLALRRERPHRRRAALRPAPGSLAAAQPLRGPRVRRGGAGAGGTREPAAGVRGTRLQPALRRRPGTSRGRLRPGCAIVAAMDRHTFLAGLHARLDPRTYLEIGVQDGKSLALGSAPRIGVDPEFQVKEEIQQDVHLARTTSDEFFARRRPLAHLPWTCWTWSSSTACTWPSTSSATCWRSSASPTRPA